MIVYQEVTEKFLAEVPADFFALPPDAVRAWASGEEGHLATAVRIVGRWGTDVAYATYVDVEPMGILAMSDANHHEHPSEEVAVECYQRLCGCMEAMVTASAVGGDPLVAAMAYTDNMIDDLRSV